MSRLARVRTATTGRDRDGSDRLVTGRFTHRVAVFQGPPVDRWALDGAAVDRLVVGLHGLGADERQFATLLDLDLPPGALYLGLRAPIDYGGNGYSWYDPTLDAGQIDHRPVVGRVADAVRAVQDRVDVSAAATTIVGYSQAAALVVAGTALRPDVATDVVLGSAALPPGLTDLGPGRPERAFVAVGTRDPFVEPATVDGLARAWASIPGGITVRRYDVPHVMSPAIADDVSSWIDDGSAGR